MTRRVPRIPQPDASSRPTRRALLVGLVTIQSLLVALSLTWPTAASLGQRALGSPDTDTWKHLWNLWWVRAHFLGEASTGLHTGLVNHPVGMELWPIEPLNDLVALALGGVSVVPLANLLAIGNLWLTGLSACLLGWELSRSRSGALAAGLLLQGSAFASHVLVIGVGELQHLWVLPLGCWALLRLQRSLRWRWCLLTAALLVLAVLASFYYGLFLMVALLVLGVGGLVTDARRGALLLRLVVAAALAFAAVLPLANGFSATYDGSAATAQEAPAPAVEAASLQGGVEDEPHTRLRPLQVLRPGHACVFRPDRIPPMYSGGRLLGVAAVCLLLLGLRASPRRAVPWAMLVLVGFLLALGSLLTLDSGEALLGGHVVPLPFLALNRLLAAVAQPLHFPARFIALCSLGIAALGALAFGGANWRHAALLWGLVGVSLVEVGSGRMDPWPLPGFTLPDVGPVAERADALDPAHQPVLDLSSMARDDREGWAWTLAAQMAHERPVQAVPIERLSELAHEGRDLASSLALGAQLAHTAASPASDPWFDWCPDLATLRAHGFGLILVSPVGEGSRLPESLRPALTNVPSRTSALPNGGLLIAVPASGREMNEARRRCRDLARARQQALPPEGGL